MQPGPMPRCLVGTKRPRDSWRCFAGWSAWRCVPVVEDGQTIASCDWNCTSMMAIIVLSMVATFASYAHHCVREAPLDTFATGRPSSGRRHDHATLTGTFT